MIILSTCHFLKKLLFNTVLPYTWSYSKDENKSSQCPEALNNVSAHLCVHLLSPPITVLPLLPATRQMDPTGGLEFEPDIFPWPTSSTHSTEVNLKDCNHLRCTMFLDWGLARDTPLLNSIPNVPWNCPLRSAISTVMLWLKCFREMIAVVAELGQGKLY